MGWAPTPVRTVAAHGRINRRPAAKLIVILEQVELYADAVEVMDEKGLSCIDPPHQIIDDRKVKVQEVVQVHRMDVNPQAGEFLKSQAELAHHENANVMGIDVKADEKIIQSAPPSPLRRRMNFEVGYPPGGQKEFFLLEQLLRARHANAIIRMRHGQNARSEAQTLKNPGQGLGSGQRW
jgi:hypothetical protein